MNKQELNTEASFDIESFNNPPKEYWPVYTWQWNGTITKHDIKRQLDDFKRRKIFGVYIIATPASFRPTKRPTPLEPDFDTDEFYELYKFAADYAKSLSICFWLYDEPGFPSGSAGGNVVKSNPELIKKGIARKEIILKKGQTYKIENNILAAFYMDSYRIQEDFTAQEDGFVAEYCVSAQNPYPMPYPDLLDSRMSPVLIKELFNKYKKIIGNHFGDNTRYVFIDEPAAPVLAWTYNMDEIFFNRYGYDAKEFLPAIVNPFSQGEKGTLARIDYYELCSELFIDNYLLPVKKWCNENNLLLTGHFGGEDMPFDCIRHGYYHVMKMLRSLDVPGVDVIWRQIFSGDKKSIHSNLGNIKTAGNHFFPRFASSAANQTGSRYSVSETGAVYGAGLTFSQLRYITVFQMTRGINLFNYMSVYFSSEGHLMASARPNFVPEIPYYKDIDVFNEYVARMSKLMSLGDIDVSVALYLPVRDIWAQDMMGSRICSLFEEVANKLEQNQCYFDIFDDDTVIECNSDMLKSGVLKIGKAQYTTLIVPSCRFIKEETLKRIEKFAASGGKIIVVKDDIIEKLHIKNAKQCPLGEIQKQIKPVVNITPKIDKISAIKRINDEGDSIYLISNENDEKVSIYIEFDENRQPYQADALTGDFYEVEGTLDVTKFKAELTLECGEGKVFVFSDDGSKLVDIRSCASQKIFEIETITDFTFKRIEKFTVGENHLENTKITERETNINCGDWRDKAGADFSGSAVYISEFSIPENIDEIYVDLGKVNYSSELFINGKSQGVKIMPPYVYKVENKYLRTENKIEIRVTNTPANEFVAKDEYLTRKHTSAKLGSYHHINTYFERDSLESGLFGPVRILGRDV